MKCPFCKGNSKTLQSRQRQRAYQRRHECLICHKRFTTYEIQSQDYALLKSYEDIEKILHKINKIKEEQNDVEGSF